MICEVCKQNNLKLMLWQTTLNKYVNFCSEECIKVYLMNKYKKSQHQKVIGIALELTKPYEGERCY